MAVLIACSDQRLPTENIVVPLFAKGGQTGFNLGTHLTGDEEVLASNAPAGSLHPSVSPAQGHAIFRVSRDLTSFDFRLIAANIENVTMAHIHCGRPGENGPISVWLYPSIGTSGTAAAAGGGSHDGVLNEGTFQSLADVVCPASAVGTTMSLLEAMRRGLTYVNVHTSDGITTTVPPINTGPGDFPGGEIRGQIDHASPHDVF